jgi:hypothetical protein
VDVSTALDAGDDDWEDRHMVVFKDPGVQPTPGLIEEALDDAAPCWTMLTDHFADVGAPVEWRYYREGGWLGKAVGKGRTVGWLSVEEIRKSDLLLRRAAPHSLARRRESCRTSPGYCPDSAQRKTAPSHSRSTVGLRCWDRLPRDRREDQDEVAATHHCWHVNRHSWHEGSDPDASSAADADASLADIELVPRFHQGEAE